MKFRNNKNVSVTSYTFSVVLTTSSNFRKDFRKEFIPLIIIRKWLLHLMLMIHAFSIKTKTFTKLKMF